MPCNTIQRSKVEFLATSTDIPLLRDALQSLGYTVTGFRNQVLGFRTGNEIASFNKATGQLTLPVSCDVNAIKLAYSAQIVQSQAAKHGWKIAWSTNAQGRREAMVQRRG